MEVNYVLVFIIVTIVAFVPLKKLLFVPPKETETNRKRRPIEPTPITDFFITTFFCLLVGGAVCLLCFIFSSKVYEIRDANQYDEKDYLLYYKDANEEWHIVVPFTNYLYNNSSRRVIATPIYYGSHRYKSQQEDDIEIFDSKVFKRIINKPEYIFETPPEVIRIKGHSKGTTRYMLSYE